MFWLGQKGPFWPGSGIGATCKVGSGITFKVGSGSGITVSRIRIRNYLFSRIRFRNKSFRIRHPAFLSLFNVHTRIPTYILYSFKHFGRRCYFWIGTDPRFAIADPCRFAPQFLVSMIWILRSSAETGKCTAFWNWLKIGKQIRKENTKSAPQALVSRIQKENTNSSIRKTLTALEKS